MSNIELILKAQKLGKNFIYKTPLLYSSKVNEILGKNIFTLLPVINIQLMYLVILKFIKFLL